MNVAPPARRADYESRITSVVQRTFNVRRVCMSYNLILSKYSHIPALYDVVVRAQHGNNDKRSKPFGLLVLLSYDVTIVIPAAYQRSHLLRSLGLFQQGCLILEQVSRFRCFQRLSFLDMATLLCHWRDNRYTVGPVTPVLSY
jgi:hypothetical protein